MGTNPVTQGFSHSLPPGAGAGRERGRGGGGAVLLPHSHRVCQLRASPRHPLAQHLHVCTRGQPHTSPMRPALIQVSVGAGEGPEPLASPTQTNSYLSEHSFPLSKAGRRSALPSQAVVKTRQDEAREVPHSILRKRSTSSGAGGTPESRTASLG